MSITPYLGDFDANPETKRIWPGRANPTPAGRTRLAPVRQANRSPRRPTAIWYVNHFDPGHHVEQLAAHMAGSSDAGRSETDLARIGLGVGYELRDCLGWNRRIDHHDEREADDACDGGDVAEKNEIEFVVKARVDRVRRSCDEERIAVRRRPHDRLGSYIAAATRAVFDDELLAQPLREHGPISRAIMSGAPPGPVGAMMRTGRVG
jgi:hypothetical protein